LADFIKESGPCRCENSQRDVRFFQFKLDAGIGRLGGTPHSGDCLPMGTDIKRIAVIGTGVIGASFPVDALAAERDRVLLGLLKLRAGA
jgi:hypothetical protein